MSGLTSASQNVASLVAEQASLRPASPAIITHEEIITYGQLRVAVGVVARHLRKNGVVPGQVVGVSLAQNSLHIITLLAIAQLGGVSLALHVAIPEERRNLAAKRFNASCVVSGRNEMALPGLKFISLGSLSFDGISIAPDEEVFPVESEIPFRIALSSGTSGDPKGMVISHGLMARRNSRPEPGLTFLSRLVPMDLNFAVGFGTALRVLGLGASVVLPRSADPEHMMQAIVSHGVTHITLSPAQAQSIVDRFAVEDIHCPGMVCLRIGGGPCSPELLDKIKGFLTPNVHVIYGSSESGVVSYAPPQILESHPRSVGQVCDWAEIQVVNEDGLLLPALEIGHIRIRTADQVSGYSMDEERNKRYFRDGWFYPGDLGGFDEQGLLYIEGRADSQLNIGGLKVNPEDIDEALLAHGDVADAGSFVLVDNDGLELLVAAIVLHPGGKIEGLPQYAAGRLGPLAPSRYFVVPSLPRTITGKLRRSELTAQFSKSDEMR